MSLTMELHWNELQMSDAHDVGLISVMFCCRLLVTIWDAGVMARRQGAQCCKGTIGAMRRQVSAVLVSLPRHLTLRGIIWLILCFMVVTPTCAAHPVWWLGPPGYAAVLWLLVYAGNIYHR